MSTANIFFNAKTAIALIFYLSMPMLLVATGVGLLIALFQAATQLQEQILGFLAKLTAIIVVMALTSDWMGGQMMLFMDRVFEQVLRL